ncbi:MAG: hypothetical protein QOK40_131 [Miltoncostaeaceae bacterium]|nr:hypothetical protein [Miltoncostaeaceae bacterium]
MSFFSDHPVAAAAILIGVLVIPSLLFVAMRGLGLWRAMKASKSAVEPKAARLTADAERLQAEIARLSERRVPEAMGSLESLKKRVAEVGVVAGAASEGVRGATAPLRYLGR